MAKKYSVKLTENFERNLEEIEAFAMEADAPHAFDLLLNELIETVIPNLERFPEMGRSFMARRPASVEGVNGLERLERQLEQLGPGGEIREYVSQHHLILYAVIKNGVYLLSIRHQKQLSFDFQSLWSTGK